MDARFPQVASTTKQCVECKKDLRRALFTERQFLSKTPVCKECRPVDDRFLKRVKSTKSCVECLKELPRDSFTDTQWERGSKSKCKLCVAKQQISQKQHTKQCQQCKVKKAKDAFSKTQWEYTGKVGSTCKECCETNMRKRKLDFAQEHGGKRSKDAGTSETAGVECWETQDVAEALRWLLHVPLTSLPSTLTFLIYYMYIYTTYLYKYTTCKLYKQTYHALKLVDVCKSPAKCIFNRFSCTTPSFRHRQEDGSGNACSGQKSQLVDEGHQS